MSVTAIASMLVGPIASLLDKVIPDKDERIRLAHEIATLAERQAHEISMAQIEVNKIEAQSASLFKGGWRPATGWACVLVLANNFIVVPYVEAFTPYDVPVLDFNVMAPILLGMLGLTAARTIEKVKGVASP